MPGTFLPLSFRSHARSWQDALPLGNGRSGMLLFGGLACERLILCHSGCWLPLERRSPPPEDLSDVLAEIRELLWEGKPREAELRWLTRCKNAGMRFVGTDSCHPAAGIRIQLGGLADSCGYRRHLDPRQGIAGVTWTEPGAGLWQRRAWVDRSENLMFWEQEGPHPLHLHLTLDRVNAENEQVWIASTYPGLDPEGWQGHRVPVVDLVNIRTGQERECLWLQGHYLHGPGGWCAAVRFPGAQLEQDSLQVHTDSRAGLIMAVEADPEAPPSLEKLLDRLEAASIPEGTIRTGQSVYFDRCRLDLGNQEDPTPMEDQLAQAADGFVPLSLWQQLWNMSRGCFLAACAPESPFPPHLQGIWSGTWNPPWFGCYTNDENVQMMHWQAVAGNLPEMLTPLRTLIQNSLPSWRENASRIFNCSGVLAPLQQGGAFSVHQQAEWLGWTGGAGWLSRHLWDAWLLSGDPDILEQELLPLLLEILSFYEEFLVKGQDGWFHALPSISVENQPPGWPSRLTRDATMEHAILREVLRHTRNACQAVNQEVPEVYHLLVSSLPPYRYNASGELAEWIDPEHADQHAHRHLSHLYPLFPGDEASVNPDPELREGIRRVLNARLRLGQQSQTGWSLVHLAHLHARLGEGEEALACLERLVRTCCQANLLTVHDDWRGQGLTLGGGERERGTLQLDALFATASAMQECLIQSEADRLALLPALPRAWPEGSVEGAGTRCGLEVDLYWAHGKAEAHLRAIRDTKVRLFPGCCFHSGDVEILEWSAGDTQTLSFSLPVQPDATS